MKEVIRDKVTTLKNVGVIEENVVISKDIGLVTLRLDLPVDSIQIQLQSLP